MSAPTAPLTGDALLTAVTVQVNGSVVSLNSVDLRPQVTNTVSAVHVKEGQVIAQLDECVKGNVMMPLGAQSLNHFWKPYSLRVTGGHV